MAPGGRGRRRSAAGPLCRRSRSGGSQPRSARLARFEGRVHSARSPSAQTTVAGGRRPRPAQCVEVREEAGGGRPSARRAGPRWPRGRRGAATARRASAGTGFGGHLPPPRHAQVRDGVDALRHQERAAHAQGPLPRAPHSGIVVHDRQCGTGCATSWRGTGCATCGAASSREQSPSTPSSRRTTAGRLVGAPPSLRRAAASGVPRHPDRRGRGVAGYRPHNDVRYARTPYKTFLGAVAEWPDGVGTFVQVGPRGLLVATGIPQPAPDQLARLRAGIAADGSGTGFASAVERVEARGARVHGGRWDPLVRVPRGYSTDHPGGRLRWKGVEIAHHAGAPPVVRLDGGARPHPGLSTRNSPASVAGHARRPERADARGALRPPAVSASTGSGAPAARGGRRRAGWRGGPARDAAGEADAGQARCPPSPPASSTSRSGTASARSSSGTATRWRSAAATSDR